MIVVNDILTSNIEFEDTYVAIGNFDGVHYGHTCFNECSKIFF